MNPSRILAPALLLVLGSAALAGRPVFHDVGFDEIVAKAELIAVVTRANPANRAIQVPIEEKHPDNQPYTLEIDRYKVVKVLKGTLPPPGLDPGVIEATYAHWRMAYEYHRVRTLEGKTISWPATRYAGDFELDGLEPGKEFVVFLAHDWSGGPRPAGAVKPDAPGFSGLEYLPGGFESVEKVPEIESRIQKGP